MDLKLIFELHETLQIDSSNAMEQSDIICGGNEIELLGQVG